MVPMASYSDCGSVVDTQGELDTVQLGVITFLRLTTLLEVLPFILQVVRGTVSTLPRSSLPPVFSGTVNTLFRLFPRRDDAVWLGFYLSPF